MMDTSSIKEDMEVKSAEGQHVGRVDRIEGGEIKLRKQDTAAHVSHHHFIPTDWVDHVGSHVHLNRTRQDVMTHWRHGNT